MTIRTDDRRWTVFPDAPSPLSHPPSHRQPRPRSPLWQAVVLLSNARNRDHLYRLTMTTRAMARRQTLSMATGLAPRTAGSTRTVDDEVPRAAVQRGAAIASARCSKSTTRDETALPYDLYQRVRRRRCTHGFPFLFSFVGLFYPIDGMNHCD